jgi:hypothetical protein
MAVACHLSTAPLLCEARSAGGGTVVQTNQPLFWAAHGNFNSRRCCQPSRRHAVASRTVDLRGTRSSLFGDQQLVAPAFLSRHQWDRDAESGHAGHAVAVLDFLQNFILVNKPSDRVRSVAPCCLLWIRFNHSPLGPTRQHRAQATFIQMKFIRSRSWCEPCVTCN